MFVKEAETGGRPCVILAHRNPEYLTQTARSFRAAGWRVLLADAGAVARRLARLVVPALVVLDTALDLESGWLTCAKLTAEQPGVKVVLVTPEPNATGRDFADFVGAAALLAEDEGVQTLLDEPALSATV